MINDLLILKSINVIPKDNKYVLTIEFKNFELQMINQEIVFDDYNDAMNELILICNSIKA
jgi:hypothetical protein